MKTAFQQTCQQLGLVSGQVRVLAAVSGGVDSVVLARLLHAYDLLAGIAHVNYQKRGADSDGDELFVQALAAELQVDVHVKRVDDDALEQEQGHGFQEKARNIRYDFFEGLRIENNYSHIATGHQLDDNLETLLHHLVRGAGIRGLRGILPQKDFLIRPMLFASREQIVALAKYENWSWREDSSNASLEYTRNQIRHHWIPRLQEENPKFTQQLDQTFRYLRDTEWLFQQQMNHIREQAVATTHDGIRIDLTQLPDQAQETVLYELLSPYQFNSTQISQLIQALHHTELVTFFSPTHTLEKERTALVIRQQETTVPATVTIVPETQTAFLTLQISPCTDCSIRPKASNEAYLDRQALQWPLTFRVWQPGDRISPVGLNGSRKISDVLTDLKVEQHQKKRMPVLVSGDDVVWMPGYRIAAQYGLQPHTQEMVHLTFDPINYV